MDEAQIKAAKDLLAKVEEVKEQRAAILKAQKELEKEGRDIKLRLNKLAVQARAAQALVDAQEELLKMDQEEKLREEEMAAELEDAKKRVEAKAQAKVEAASVAVEGEVVEATK